MPKPSEDVRQRQKRSPHHPKHWVQLPLRVKELCTSSEGNYVLLCEATAWPGPTPATSATLLGKQCLTTHLTPTSLFPTVPESQGDRAKQIWMDTARKHTMLVFSEQGTPRWKGTDKAMFIIHKTELVFLQGGI